MYSGKVELGELPPINDDERDENVSCIKLSGLKEEELNLNKLAEEVAAENSFQSDKSTSENSNVSHAITKIYAQVVVVLSSTAIFSELLHQHIPLFYCHDYLFLYLLLTSVILLSGALLVSGLKYIDALIRDFVKKSHYLTKEFVVDWNRFDIDQFFKTSILLFGLAVFASNVLEVKALFISPSFCINATNTTNAVLRCIFIGLQILFFLLSSKEILNIFGKIRNFAFMHLFATNSALWIRLFLWESAKDWETSLHIKHNSSLKWEKNELNISVHAVESDFNSIDPSKHYPNHVIHYTSNCWWRIQKSDEVDVISIQNCLENSTVGTMWSKTSELLFPLVVQYYIIILCVLYVVWFNFNSKNINYFFNLSKKSRSSEICSRSTKGLFLGLIVLITSIIIVIIYFTVGVNSKLVFRILYCLIFTSSSCAAVQGIYQTRKMLARESVDMYCANIFQNAGLLAVCFYGSCNIIAGAASEEKFSFVLSLEAVFMMLHASLQNVFIAQVSQKKIDDLNVNVKPGRQPVVYLIFCNMSLWILECFVSWNFSKKDLQLYIFGNVAWPIIIRITFPFLNFYRYHSFISLLKAWKLTYT